MGLRSCVLFIDSRKLMIEYHMRHYSQNVDDLALQGNLYADGTMRVRVGQGQNTAMTECFPLERGVRQGWPLSPVLFNIFINDLWDDRQVPSLQVLTGCTNDPHFIQIRGAIFADNAAYITGSLIDTEKVCDRISTWSETNEMEVGIHKCGLLEFPSTYKDQPEPSNNRFTQQKTEIGSALEYKQPRCAHSGQI